MDDTYKLALMLRAALEEAHDAMAAFTDPEGDMPENTGEFRDLKLALESARLALAAGTIEDVEKVEADNQRIRDKCIGYYGQKRPASCACSRASNLCGCREGECESKTTGCRMAAEIGTDAQ